MVSSIIVNVIVSVYTPEACGRWLPGIIASISYVPSCVVPNQSPISCTTPGTSRLWKSSDSGDNVVAAPKIKRFVPLPSMAFSTSLISYDWFSAAIPGPVELFINRPALADSTIRVAPAVVLSFVNILTVPIRTEMSGVSLDKSKSYPELIS